MTLPIDQGAVIKNKYHELSEDVCPVPKSAILDNSSSALEEVWQFSVGGFLFSGSFWLGMERLMTEGYQDPLFLGCVAFVISGALLALTGYRQAKRRIARLEKYLPKDLS